MMRLMDGIQIGRLWLHRREQWDLGHNSSLKPLLVAHWRRPNATRRLFAVWCWGLLVGHRVFERRIDRVIREANL